MLIVGIGASAGGLEALEEFFTHVPVGSGLAYVVVQHLAPQHDSMLSQLLGHHSTVPILDAQDGMTVQANHAYVITPGTLLTISGGAFHVRPIDVERHEQIDAFLQTLAEDQGKYAVGVVLSGLGEDGTKGLRAIKQHGGLTFSQAPETAKYDNMPRSAINAGVVDHVLPIDKMPAQLLERARQLAEAPGEAVTPPAAVAPPGAAAPSDEQLVASLARICEILQRATGHDFRHYKRGTVLRRLRRRLSLRPSLSLDEYIDLLAAEAQEPELLAKDLLIGVTQFFRDPEAFEYIGSQILPQILAVKGAGEGVRIWVPGCASGEEAYSLGMLVRERLAGLRSAPPVQIFATDIDTEAIAEARQARYPPGIAQHLTPERLARFFTQDGSAFHVAREVREMCIFSEHSLIRDPPFLDLDLISCRNVLIYLDAEMQKKLIPVFHYSLRRGGYLFLGPSEGLSGHSGLFETVDKRFHIFKRAESVTRLLVEFPVASRSAPRAAPALHRAPVVPPAQEQAINIAFERLMLQEYVPPGAVVNAQGDILCVAGPTGQYLQPPAGILSTNILDIAHASLRIELRTALHAAAHSGKRVVRDGVQAEVDGLPRWLRLVVRPMPGFRHEGGLFMVILQERAGGAETVEPGESPEVGAGGEPAIEQLESELRTTRASLRATIEELESANEELKSSNEEMLSTNEELQSANEELQSSQEELKSVNEELATVNAELSRKVEELGRANSDLQNLFSSTDVATLFLDCEQRVTKYTPAAKTLFRLIEADAGRPLADLAPRFVGQDLTAIVSEVLRTLRPLELQAETIDRQAWYLLRVLPYRTVENVIAGAVVTLADITQIKNAEAGLRRLATVVLDSNDAVTVQDLEGHILDWNRAAERIYGYSAAEAKQLSAEALVPEEGRAQARGLLEAIRRGEAVAPLEVTRRTKDGRTLDVWLTITKFVDDRGWPAGVLTTERDITGRKRADEVLRASEEKYRTLFESIDEGLCVIEVLFDTADNPIDYRFLEVNRAFEKQTGIPNAVGRRMREIAPEFEEHWFRIYGRVALTGEPLRFENPAVALGRYHDVYAFRIGRPEQRRVALLIKDITERRHMEAERGRLIQELRQAQEQLSAELDATSRLLEIGSLFVKAGNREPVLGAIVDAAIAISGADFGSIQLVDRESGDLKIMAHRGFPPWWVAFWDRVSKGHGVCGTALERRERVIVEDVEQSPIFMGTPALEIQLKAGVRAVQSTPLLSRSGEPVGMLSTHYRAPRSPSKRELRLLDLLCRQAADILERAQADLALEEANRRLLEADRRKDEFLGMLSHELRNPLAPIRNSLYILGRAAPGGEQARRAQEVIERQVGHMTRLIEDLLDVTRITRGKVQLQRELLDLNELVRQTVEDLHGAFAASGVALELMAAPAEVWVNGDRTRLAQVIGNLLHNAVKFTPRGERTAVSVERDAASGQAIVRVQDTGRGIAPEFLPRLFEPFYQADSSLDRSMGGLGLGLALVKGLVEMHGGAVSAASDGPNKGTSFTITLPLEATGAAGTHRPHTGTGQAHRRVLIIEDNIDAANSLRDLLLLGGHDVEAASTGPEGIGKARAFGPDVVICDIGLPGMSGFEVARAMRADPGLRRVKLIALTGYAGPEDAAKAREAGFDIHFAKPLSLEALERILAGSGAAPSPGPR